VTASALVAHVGDAKQFKNGRELAAYLGLTPREHSSGGKQKLLGITKRGNTYIRKLLIQGARNLCRAWARTVDAASDGRKAWLQGVVARRGPFVASVAQANKTARIAWAVLARGEEYQAAKATS
jgi:transposase